jgi:phosphoribosylpyrophosphate synthetase
MSVDIKDSDGPDPKYRKKEIDMIRTEKISATYYIAVRSSYDPMRVCGVNGGGATRAKARADLLRQERSAGVCHARRQEQRK